MPATRSPGGFQAASTRERSATPAQAAGAARGRMAMFPIVDPDVAGVETAPEAAEPGRLSHQDALLPAAPGRTALLSEDMADGSSPAGARGRRPPSRGRSAAARR